MDAQEYVNSVESELSQLVQSGTKGSFLTNVLESQDVKSAYEKLLAQEESKLAELSSKIKEGKMDKKMSLDAAIASGMTKSFSERYASRKTLFQCGYDKVLAPIYFIKFLNDSAEEESNG